MRDASRTASRLVKRGIWSALSPMAGSEHDHFRQALWVPTRQGLEGVTLSEPFGGIEGASGLNRRSWENLGVVAVSREAMDDLLKRDGARPAVAFTMGRLLVVGELADPNGFGHLTAADGELGEVAHGLRLGPGDTQFAIGTITSVGFETPAPGTVSTLLPIKIGDISPSTQYAKLNFS